MNGRDHIDEIAATSENVPNEPPFRMAKISACVNECLNHAIVKHGFNLLEVRLVAANFKALADNWQPPKESSDSDGP